MSSLLTRMRNDSGQAFVFVAVASLALVGMAALVIDGGSCVPGRSSPADRGRCRGARRRPAPSYGAVGSANGRARLRAEELRRDPAPAVSFPDVGTINVSATAQAPGIFAGIFHIDEVTVRAQAQAGVFAPEKVKDVAPIGVHTSMACIVTDPTCYGQQKTLTFDEDSPFDPTKSKFGLLDLDRDGTRAPPT